jgi:hypothetical protein
MHPEALRAVGLEKAAILPGLDDEAGASGPSR